MNASLLQAYVRRHHWMLMCAAALLALLLLAMSSAPARADGSNARATVRDAAGNFVANVNLFQAGDRVVVTVSASTLPAGFHGFHIHTVGACVAPFTTAGGHFDPAAGNHANHAGDLPVLLVNANGTAEAATTTDRFRLNDLFDADGSAIIVHASPDNYANIPTRYAPAPDATTLATGDAGARIGCGVIRR